VASYPDSRYVAVRLKTRPCDAMQPAKRQRKLEERTVPPRALVSCFDEPDKFVEVDTALLEPFNCRLYGVIKHDPPHVDALGRKFWKVNMSRAMLQTLIRSLEHGELSLGKTVSVQEAITTFEYENIPVGVPATYVGTLQAARHVQSARPGAVFEKRAERLAQIIHQTTESCAHAIATWPRLESCLDAALAGVPICTTCTATRIWVNFCRKPLSSSDRAMSTVNCANRWANWLKTTLISYGMTHARLVRDQLVTEGGRDEKSFTALFTAVQGDMLGWLANARHDFTKLATDKTTRRELLAAEAFAIEMRNAVVENDTTTNESRQRLDYARGCFSMADTQLQDSPNISTIFSGSCSDDVGKSPERAQLAKALGQRGIKVVKWSQDHALPKHPLMFPPVWRESGASGSCVLLDFSDRR